VVGELLFTGLAQAARKTDLTVGTQIEGAYTLNAAHILRGGLIVSTDRTTSRTVSQVLPVDDTGAQTSDRPLAIADNSKAAGWSYSAFLQDEWSLADGLTLNYGLRFDQVQAFRRENQLSPRVNLVYRPLEGTTLHAGYARYFTPPPFELVATQTIGKFVGTSAQAPGTQNDAPRSERDHYFDLGIEQRLAPGLTMGLDAYYKTARNLIDEGQFGAPIILTPFNYADGYAKGVELSANYQRGPLSAYANLALSQAKGRDIVSSQFNFDPADLAYIAGHDIFLDHDQTYTISAGAAYRIGPARLSGDVLHGSGLRRDGDVPNGGKLPGYTQVNLGAAYELARRGGEPLTLRVDVINIFDKRYAIRDGSGVGVGAPQFGPRRGVFAGVSKAF
jgi:outer membrane receptor protein involved in Fe transport